MHLKNFNWPTEFDSPDSPGSGANMQQSTLVKLQKARDIARFPFKINSAYRTPEHNRKVGGTPDSAHTRGHAVDIQARTGMAKFKILQAVIKAGFNRIGIYRTFVHVDDDPTLPQDVIWLG